MRKFIAILLLVFVPLLTCNVSCFFNGKGHAIMLQKQLTQSGEPLEVTFKTGYPANHKFVNTVDDPEKGLLIYFADPRSKKCIKFFELENNSLVDSVSLDCIFEKETGIEAITVISRDEIVVLSHRTNRVYILNGKGECIRQMELDALYKGGNRYEFAGSAYSAFHNDNAIYLNANWISDPVIDTMQAAGDIIRYHYKKVRSSPYLAKLSGIQSGEPKLEFADESYYETFVSPGEAVIEPSYFAVSNGRIFLTSFYSNRIWIMDPDNLKITGSIPLSSSKTAIGSSPITLSEGEIQSLQPQFDTINQRNGRIHRIFFDISRKSIYIVVLHQLKPDADVADPRPWTLYVYSMKSKTVISEITFPGGEYIPGNIVFTGDALLISSNVNSRDDYQAGLARFHRYDIKEL